MLTEKKANKEYMSVSQFKAFSKCPASALAEIKGKYKRDVTTALLVGSYVDSYFEGTLEIFKKKNPEIFKKDGSLKADYTQANLIIQRILADKLFSEYLSGQKQVIMTGNICGVPVKIKIDSLHDDKIVDLKVMASLDNVYTDDNGFCPFFEAWEYDLQGAVYQEIVRQNTGKKLPFYLAAATKEKVTDIDIVTWHMKPKDIKQAENLKHCKNAYLDAFFLVYFVPLHVLLKFDVDDVINILKTGRKSVPSTLGEKWEINKLLKKIDRTEGKT